MSSSPPSPHTPMPTEATSQETFVGATGPVRDPGTAKIEWARQEAHNIIAAVDRDEVGIVQGADRLEDALASMGYLYRMQIAPRQVGWDPANRGGEGGNAKACFHLMERIAQAGWSWQECQAATCVEVEPNTKDVEVFNRRLCTGAGLPDVEENSIGFGSLACGHTNMGLRAIAAGVKSDALGISRDGRLSVEVIRAKDPDFAEAVERGLRWKVLRHQVRAEFPEALRILQATNTPLLGWARAMQRSHNMASSL